MGSRVAVILAGGIGSRFWPMSRKDRPKQLVALTHPTRTMLDEAIERLSPVVDASNIYVAASDSVRDALRTNAANVFVEPHKRHTLGALVWVAAHLVARGQENATLAVLAADHYIGDVHRFQGAIDRAMSLAESDDVIVTFGVRPTRPETGFGYIEVAEADGESLSGLRVVRFREKPPIDLAQQFLLDDVHFWNSGMFFVRVSTLRAMLCEKQPAVAAGLDRVAAAITEGRDAAAEFASIPALSIDVGLLEQGVAARMLVADFAWEDLGTWSSIDRAWPSDEEGNVNRGGVITKCEGCVVVNEVAGRKVVVTGLRDVIVVVTDEGVLVCAKDEAQSVGFPEGA